MRASMCLCESQRGRKFQKYFLGFGEDYERTKPGGRRIKSFSFPFSEGSSAIPQILFARRREREEEKTDMQEQMLGRMLKKILLFAYLRLEKLFRQMGIDGGL